MCVSIIEVYCVLWLLFCSVPTSPNYKLLLYATSIPSPLHSAQPTSKFHFRKINKTNRTTQHNYFMSRFIISKPPHTSQYDQQHTPAQETKDQPRVPECTANDDTVADEPVQPRQPQPRETPKASANWRARSRLYSWREAGGRGDAVLGQMIVVLFVSHIPKLLVAPVYNIPTIPTSSSPATFYFPFA